MRVFNFLNVAYLRVYPKNRNIFVLFPLPVVPRTNITSLFLIKALASFVLLINLYNSRTLMVIIFDFSAQRFSYNYLWLSYIVIFLKILTISPGKVPKCFLKFYSSLYILFLAYLSSGIIWTATAYISPSYLLIYDINNSLCSKDSNESLGKYR